MTTAVRRMQPERARVTFGPVAAAMFAMAAVSSPVTWGQDKLVELAEDTSPAAITILVADPLAKELACDCVAGFAQRRYEALAMVLEKRLGRPVKSFCGTKLSAFWGDDQPLSLIIGKQSEVIYQADQLGRKVYPIAALTDLQSATTFHGLFVVRAGNRAKSLRDLQGYRLILGPASCDEKHRAALEALRKLGISASNMKNPQTVPSCTDAANELMKLSDDDDTVAVISDYAKVLLEGCHTVPPGALRVIGKTAPLPFVTVFATDEVAPSLRSKIRQELVAARRYAILLRLLESKDGFRPIESQQSEEQRANTWPDFRGPNRDAVVPALPKTLDAMRIAWTAPLEGRGLGGIAVTQRWVLATDRVEEAKTDYLKMFDIQTGQLRFSGELVEPTGLLSDKSLDFGNSIRATPVVHEGTVYVLDALGCVYRWTIPQSGLFPETECLTGTSTALLVDDFKLTTWGVSPTPLLAKSKEGNMRLIVNVCSASHTLLALDPQALVVQWMGAGKSTGYASCIAGEFGGRRQVVGYDSCSLGGWDLETGERIWTVTPEYEGDFNVPTPVALDQQRLLVVTESNAMRIYAFDEQGTLKSQPVAVNEDVANDTVTPVVVAGKAYCTSDGALMQLDTDKGLQTRWTMTDKAFNDHVSLIADAAGRRLLVTTYQGELLLFDIAGDEPAIVSRRTVCAPGEREEIYSHPSFVGNRLFVRGLRTLKCLQF